jgi:NAD(P)-dependent dehydrogenase (short-subunit alcohol dehydrogenase family)
MKSVFLTGATGGLGNAVARALSERGYTVFAAGTNQEKLERLGSLEGVIPVWADVTDMASVEKACETVRSYTDRLYAVINLAGLTAFCSMVEGDCVATTEKLLDINVTGMVRVNRVFFELVRAGGGRIINCSSEAGWGKSQPFAAPYYLSKRAVEAYNDSLRRELMFLGVPVVKIQPGPFNTNLMGDIINGFEKTLSETTYYGDVLSRMKPMMTAEIGHGSDPALLAKVMIKALEAKRPRLCYRVGTGKLTAILALLPEGAVDAMYRFYMSRRKPA